MAYEIQEIGGKKYRVFPNGGRLIIQENRFPHLPRHAGVYLLKDSESGLSYVGSSNNVNQRAGNYIAKSKREMERGLFKNVKPENLTFELLDDCKYISIKDRLRLEAEWIQKLDTLHPNGLNKVLPGWEPDPAKQRRIAKTIKEQHKTSKQIYRSKPYTNILSRFK